MAEQRHRTENDQAAANACRTSSPSVGRLRIGLGILDLTAAVGLVLYRPNDRLALMAAGCLVLLGIVYLTRGYYSLRDNRSS